MHSVITNAWRGDPYPHRHADDLHGQHGVELVDEHDRSARDARPTSTTNGEYKIPFLVVCDAFQSEMTAFADLVLPDTTYLERHDVMSMLDRPISEFDGPVDSVRVPVVPPTGECKPFQEVLIELASRLKFPAFTTPRARASSATIRTSSSTSRPTPGSGIGFLIGWRGKDGDKCAARRAESEAVGDVREEQLRLPLHAARDACNTCATGTGRTSTWRSDKGLRQIQRADPDPALLRRAAEVPPRGARAQRRAGSRPMHLRERVEHVLRSAAVLVSRRSKTRCDRSRALIRSPRSRSGRWRCTTRGIRRTRGCGRSTAHNYLFVNPLMARAAGIADGGWMLGRIAVGQGALHGALQRGRRAGHGVDLERDRQGDGRVAARARTPNESQRGFLLNHLITDELPGATPAAARISNSDPITGQAGWYDVRVRIYPAEADARPHAAAVRADAGRARHDGRAPARRADLLRGARRIRRAPAQHRQAQLTRSRT